MVGAFIHAGISSSRRSPPAPLPWPTRWNRIPIARIFGHGSFSDRNPQELSQPLNAATREADFEFQFPRRQGGEITERIKPARSNALMLR